MAAIDFIGQKARDALSRYPAVFLPIYNRTRPRAFIEACGYSPATDIVIEGFPRSANSFAVTAFLSAQPGPVKIAHHAHSAAPVLAAAKAGKPIIIVVRDPVDCVASWIIRGSSLSVDALLRSYTAFHDAITPVLDAVVVSDFKTTISDFGRVVRAANAKFGSEFAPYDNSPERDQAVHADIAKLEAGMKVDGTLPDPNRVVESSALKAQARASRAHDAAAAIYADVVARGV